MSRYAIQFLFKAEQETSAFSDYRFSRVNDLYVSKDDISPVECIVLVQKLLKENSEMFSKESLADIRLWRITDITSMQELLK